MAEWNEGQEIYDLSVINGGKEFGDGDGLTSEDLNKITYNAMLAANMVEIQQNNGTLGTVVKVGETAKSVMKFEFSNGTLNITVN